MGGEPSKEFIDNIGKLNEDFYKLMRENGFERKNPFFSYERKTEIKEDYFNVSFSSQITIEYNSLNKLTDEKISFSEFYSTAITNYEFAKTSERTHHRKTSFKIPKDKLFNYPVNLDRFEDELVAFYSCFESDIYFEIGRLNNLLYIIENYCLKAIEKFYRPDAVISDDLRNYFAKVYDGYENYFELDETMFKYLIADFYSDLESGDFEELENSLDYLIDSTIYFVNILTNFFKAELVDGFMTIPKMDKKQNIVIDPLQMVVTVWDKPFSKNFIDLFEDLNII